MKSDEQISAWAHHKGTLSHIGNYDNLEDAKEGARGWKEQADNRNLAAMIFFMPIIQFDE